MRVLTIAASPGQRLTTTAVTGALRAEHETVAVRVGACDGWEHDAVGAALDVPAPPVRLGTSATTHAGQTAALLRDLGDVVARESPDVILVAGETTATLAGALVGAKRDAVVAHVGGGLRPHDRDGPDELDRVLADHCSGRLFVPSDRAAARLASAGLTDGVHRVGDVTYDALLAVRERARERSTVLDRLDHDPGSFLLATGHRPRSGRDDRLASALSDLEEPPLPVVVPTQSRSGSGVGRRLRAADLPDTVDSVDTDTYLDYVCLLDRAERVLTDAARVQKEAFYLDTPCVTVRQTTPWIETVETGRNVLVGTRPDAIDRNLRRSFRCSGTPQPYGDGTATERIVEELERAVGTAPADSASTTTARQRP